MSIKRFRSIVHVAFKVAVLAALAEYGVADNTDVNNLVAGLAEERNEAKGPQQTEEEDEKQAPLLLATSSLYSGHASVAAVHAQGVHRF